MYNMNLGIIEILKVFTVLQILLVFIFLLMNFNGRSKKIFFFQYLSCQKLFRFFTNQSLHWNNKNHAEPNRSRIILPVPFRSDTLSDHYRSYSKKNSFWIQASSRLQHTIQIIPKILASAMFWNLMCRYSKLHPNIKIQIHCMT
jgi:hypothetical protein